MNEKKYKVLEGKTILASDMTIDNALIFIKAYFEKYYNEILTLTIAEMPAVMRGDVEE